MRGARAAGRQHGAAPPACHSCLEGRGGGARRTPWPLCPSSGAGPHGRSAPETARVPVSVPRGRCGDREVRGRFAARLLRRSWCGSAGHVAAVPLAARGRMAARLFRRRMASLPSASGGAGPHGRTAPPAAHGLPALLRAGPVAARLHRVPRGTRCG
ncbi:hypothetical protein NDU88_001394 [Pleurodeles waltl]|uniref:Uncharacterized protein n=1 Tax=Pleurodeles waltl TaxID=8319 RepID=A0AAV7MSM9_PLEWA|nr:hypothetical protein NDU88_001394 [Pleurodeles waltl]